MRPLLQKSRKPTQRHRHILISLPPTEGYQPATYPSSSVGRARPNSPSHAKKSRVFKSWLKDAGSSPVLGANNLNSSDMEELGIIISNTLTDMPIGFDTEHAHVSIYPTTLGMMYLTSQLVDSLELDKELLQADPFLEALRVANTKRETCCRLIAYHSLNTKNEILDSKCVSKQTELIFKECSNEDIATLLIIILKANSYQTIAKETGMEEEAKRMAKVNAAKKSENSFIFGGKTIWGTLIDAACERYGWTFDYVVWGISYNNLTLMLKDKITSIYLSDEERKKAHIPAAGEEVIDGNNKEAVMKAVIESETEI